MKAICICGYDRFGRVKRGGDGISLPPLADRRHSLKRHKNGLKCLDCSCPVYVEKREVNLEK